MLTVIDRQVGHGQRSWVGDGKHTPWRVDYLDLLRKCMNSFSLCKAQTETSYNTSKVPEILILKIVRQLAQKRFNSNEEPTSSWGLAFVCRR